MEFRKEQKKRMSVFMALVLLFCVTGVQWNGGGKKAEAKQSVTVSTNLSTKIEVVMASGAGSIKSCKDGGSSAFLGWLKIHVVLDKYNGPVPKAGVTVIPVRYYNKKGKLLLEALEGNRTGAFVVDSTDSETKAGNYAGDLWVIKEALDGELITSITKIVIGDPYVETPTETPMPTPTPIPTPSSGQAAEGMEKTPSPQESEKPDIVPAEPEQTKKPEASAKPAQKGTQSISLSSNIKKTLGDVAFEISPAGEIHSYLKFKSSDAKVASVTSYGFFAIVKLNGAGKTKITIEAPETEEYKGAKKTVTLKVVLRQPKLTVKVKKGVMTIKWSKVDGADKYQVSVTQQGVKTTTLPLTTKTKVSNTITKGRKYIIKVRAMDKKKKFPSAWSKKTIKA